MRSPKSRSGHEAERAGNGSRESRLVYSTGGESEPEETASPARRTGGLGVRLERRASGRLVTVVSGLSGEAGEITSLSRALMSTCGAGGTVKDGLLELQGDHRDAVEVALRARGLKPRRAGG